MTQKKGKRYRKEAEQVGKAPISVAEAVEKIKSFNNTKFDQTVVCTFWLGIDPKQSDQIIRGAISLPNGIGKQKKVIAFCDEVDIDKAKEAGAVEAGCDELIKKVQDGWSDFDVAVASQKVMGKVGKLGRVLGPQGKMPSPKNGTVTSDIVTTVKEFVAGKVEFKNDTGGNVHIVVGKVGFDDKMLNENILAAVNYIMRIKPASSKGTYIKKACLAATMSPGIDITV